MMRKSIRIVRLIHRRRFRYRRMHVWRLDVLAVMILFGAGWFLLPKLNHVHRSSTGLTPRGRLSIIENPLKDVEEAVLSPALFAFTAPEGFAQGVVADQLSEIGGHVALIPSTPPRFYSTSASECFQDASLRGMRQTASLEMPAPPVFPVHWGSDAVKPGEVQVSMSIPGLVPEGHFQSAVKNGVGENVRISVRFGADGRADSVVLFSHTLDAADAVRVEQAAMRLTGPPNQSAWIVLLF